MASVEATIDVEVPVSTAYGQWTQFETFPDFMEGVVEVQQVDDKLTHWVAEIGGRMREWDAEIVEQHPDRVVAWRSLDSDMSSGRVTFAPSESGTRVSVEMEWEPDGTAEKVGAAIGLDEHQVKEDLERFKELVENRETPTGEWRGTIESGRVVDDDSVR
jgi:uncharacterized membrane protein